MKLRHLLALLLVLLGVGPALAADERTVVVGWVFAFDREGSYLVVDFPTGRQIVGVDKRDLSSYVAGDEIRIDGFGRPLPRIASR